MLRMSSLFGRTMREDPADADAPSAALLARAGYVRRAAAGIFTWLPLGWAVLRNVERVVREEMDAIGAQEVHFPALLPREPYQQTGRWDDYGDLLFRLTDRRGASYLLGPTHEEFFTLLAKGELASYKDLPVLLYQIQTKYRDEARPRAGLLRGREFVMKDSYSFDLDDAGLERSYLAHRGAYQRIFDRLQLDYRIVAAVSGAMGGSASEEFLAPASVGEDTFVSCRECGYAANTEATRVAEPTVEPVDHPPIEELDTPDTPTIETLAAHLGVPASATLKNLLIKVDGEIVAVGVPGDREVDFRRLKAALGGVTIDIVEAADFADRPDLVRGYVGPQGKTGTAFRYIADPAVAPGTAWVTGANRPDTHARNVVAGRDFTVDDYLPVAEVRDGDPCPTCGAPLAVERGVEIGHIFQLGRKYADTFSLDVLGPEGKPVRVTMGSYGIGVSRAVATIVEQHHDERGLRWPRSVAPADVHIVAAGKAAQLDAATVLAAQLEEAGVKVLLDDRAGVSAGVRFTDAELIGIPTIVVVGRRIDEGIVEVRDRAGGERRELATAELLSELSGMVRA